MKAHAGPHFDKKLHIYVNSAAKRTIAKRGAVFPVGAVIIKEKLSADGAISGIGGMIKRDPGFNLGHGDWEYFYDDKVSGYKTGKLENCSICHTRARGTDFVFSVWDMLKPG